MKREFILGFSLVTLAANQLSILAAPAPIFKPIIHQIQQNLPANLAFRLPANLPQSLNG
jgi:hypothetical protein